MGVWVLLVTDRVTDMQRGRKATLFLVLATFYVLLSLGIVVYVHVSGNSSFVTNGEPASVQIPFNVARAIIIPPSNIISPSPLIKTIVPTPISYSSTISSESKFTNSANCETGDINVFRKKTQVTYHTPRVQASCSLLRAGDKHEAMAVKSRRINWTSSISDGEFLTNLRHNCTNLREEFKEAFYTTLTERSFPIAFEMLVYYKKYSVQQYIRLLKFLYRPHNAYCIHIDKKSPLWWKDQLAAFASCFPNILIAKDPVDIKYATVTILYAHLRCLKDLSDSDLKWKYVVTLHSTELPLITNKEMVNQLIQLNGLNFIHKGDPVFEASKQVKEWMKYKVKSVYNGKWVVLSTELLDKTPHNITVYKSGSSANSALSREFVAYLFETQKVKDLLKWLKDVHSAVEFFFSTVNQMPDAPGHGDINREVAHREWSYSIIKNLTLCGNLNVVHNICIVSASDLPRLTQLSKQKNIWFFNKYFIEYDHVVMDCMEELLLQRNIQEYTDDCPIAR